MHDPLNLALLPLLAATLRYGWLKLRESRRQIRLWEDRAARAAEDVCWNHFRRTDSLLALRLRCDRLGADLLGDEIIVAAIDSFGMDDAIDRILGEVA